MSELEDLSVRAARLWLEFIQAQVKAAAAAASRLPEVTRSLAEAGVPLAAEVNRWMEGARSAQRESHEAPVPATARGGDISVPAPVIVGSPEQKPQPAPLTRAKHRRLKTPKSLSRRRARRA